jgi:type I protein arginine methyltransferase
MKVYGVDKSQLTLQRAQKIVDSSELSNKITLICGTMEEIELPVPTVDVIISEWMGYFLFSEGMISTLISARDRYLAKDGTMFPEKANVYIAGIATGADRTGIYIFYPVRLSHPKISV